MRFLSLLAVTLVLSGAFSAQVDAAVSSRATKSSRARRVRVKPAASLDSLDLARINFNKCVQIEKLSSSKSAVRCMNRILDRMDTEISFVENHVATCGERRRLENFSNPERATRVQNFVRDVMMGLRRTQESNIDANVSEVEKSGLTVGPRRMKEIEMRAAVAHMKSVRKVEDLVCHRRAFERALDRRVSKTP